MSCTECVKYLRDAGQDFHRRPAKIGLPVLRLPGGMLPCAKCAKVPVGAEPHPASAIEPTKLSARIYRHWEECEAVGWPEPDRNDPLVKRHAAIIRGVKKAVEDAKAAAIAALSALGRRE